jgi:predicted AAA+ superfamily ATPase
MALLVLLNTKSLSHRHAPCRDNGTGKSSSIKAILNRYYKDGLRMVEVYKHQFIHLPEIIGELQNRNYKFIIFMDDLSFEEYETEYKYNESGL